MGSGFADHLSQQSNLPERMLDEFLRAKARIDRHYTHQVDLMNYILQFLNGCVWIDGDTSFTSKILYLLDISMQVRTRLNMHGNNFRSGFLKCFSIAFGLNDHQVNIQWFPRVPADGLHHW